MSAEQNIHRMTTWTFEWADGRKSVLEGIPWIPPRISRVEKKPKNAWDHIMAGIED